MKNPAKLLFAGFIILSLFSFNGSKQKVNPRILVFTKTTGYRHTSISAGKAAIMQLGREHGFRVDTTENANYFDAEALKNYSAIVFLNTTGNILNNTQKLNFEHFIRTGGGYVGVHSAADTEYDWPWYGKLAGAYFLSHPKIQEAVLNVIDRSHSSTRHLPVKWKHQDEWYNYRNINSDVKVLIELDEKSYEGGTNGANHPIAWYHNYNSGRAFYTGMGHTTEAYADPQYLKHLLGGIQYAIGNK